MPANITLNRQSRWHIWLKIKNFNCPLHLMKNVDHKALSIWRISMDNRQEKIYTTMYSHWREYESDEIGLSRPDRNTCVLRNYSLTQQMCLKADDTDLTYSALNNTLIVNTYSIWFAQFLVFHAIITCTHYILITS